MEVAVDPAAPVENVRDRDSPSSVPVSACETDRGFSGTEDFWIIVAIRSEDETEIRAGAAQHGRKPRRCWVSGRYLRAWRCGIGRGGQ